MKEQFQIKAVYDEKTIRVYQAYNRQIAEEAVQSGTFGESFKLDRMTWIKPSFLWMMYRCGWGRKENQERILAIDLKREAFDYLVKSAVDSKYICEKYASPEAWKEQLKASEVRVQWDPERDIYGNPLKERSIQLGIRGDCVQRYVKEWTMQITDITDYVAELRSLMEEEKEIAQLLPQETPYFCKE